ncbi:SDR family NAD(P)-dependent oxidoreductase [Xanthomonas arboricola]|uniref:SDR family NAD(P)-dependent oxidoreductase n=1 Tax=Xanthomonas arboricola TaxID=56448 RepID=UPI00160C47CD|nr:SDR family NAD(P)-dependent oxidoreductase [Xanthomonas arboricola]MBB4730016.1 acyl transferase domain-containing protein/SAM-dependent methyltransferase [Xanthomonas arboricola]
MLEVLNRYSHGMVLVPFVDAMRRQGCLAYMASAGRFSAASLCGRFSCNEGYVAVALRMFHTLGWIEAAGDGHWQVTKAFAAHAAIPDRIMELYRFPFDGYARGSAKRSLRRWLERSADGWETADERLRDYLDGVFAIPLLLALEHHGRVRRGTADTEGRIALDLELADGPRREIEAWLLAKRWTRRDPEGLCLLPSGQSMLDRIRTTAALASYRPMLAQTATLLSGVPDDVLSLDGKGHEKHLDRTLNVVGSGFQHRRYFAALAGFVLRCFDTDDIATQPACLADTGCGDGTLLRTLYDKVLAETKRGTAIDRHPLRLAAIDWNTKALRQSALTLAGTPHTTLKGDIGDPATIVADLGRLGIGTRDDVLHVRSFLDHDRPYHPPVDATEAATRRVVGVDGVFIDHAGGRIPARDVMQSTVEHLRRWGDVVGGDGLLLLEVHSLPTAIGAAFIDEAESLHFDAYHSMSRQFLLDARSFVLAAAEAGLFCDDGDWQSYPQRMGFTRITVNHFRRHPYAVRHLHLDEDLDWLAAAPVWRAPGDMPDWAALADTTLVLVRDGRVRVAVAWREDGPRRRISLQGAWVLSAGGGRGDDLAPLLAFAAHYLLVDKTFEALENVDACRSALAEWRDASRDAWAETIAAMGTAAARRALAPGLDPRDWEAELTDVALRCVVAWLHGDVGLARGVARLKADVVANLGVLPKYHRYVDALLSRLHAHGLLRIDGDAIALTAPSQDAADVDVDVDAFERDFVTRYPHASAHLRFIQGPLRQFVDVLDGRVGAASAMFPDGDMQPFGGIFHGEPLSDYINDLIAAAVGAQRDACATAPMRILEIGAGTGGTTIPVLRTLGELAQVSYVFTDLSPAFLRRAKTFLVNRYPYVGFQVLDIEGDLAAQDFAAGTYDVVIAANVLHNTRDIAFTLSQVRALLAPGGILLLAEYTEAKTWLLFSGGLLHGTWQFEDGEKRLDDFCLLGVPRWRSELAAAGFVDVSAFGLPSAASIDASGHTVFACRAPDGAAPNSAPHAPALARGAPDHEDTQSMASPHTDPSAVDPAFESLVRDQVVEILGERRAAAFDAHRPLMQLGLDSVELVELKGAIGRSVGIKLAPAFLFENETAAKVAAALADMVTMQRPAVSRAPAEPEQAPLPGEGRAIAVIGIACRLPGANSAEAFWQLLRDGRHAIASLERRWRWPEGVDLVGEHAGIDRAGLLDRIDAFDADFFHISPHEAERLDPQQRLLLELGWEAMERSGYRPSQLAAHRTGVFVGACHNDYRDVLARAPGAGDAYVGTGSAPSMLANRLSYVYDFNGPSICIDTACSSALVAMDRAVQSLRGGECDTALLGAVNLLCSPVNSVAYYESGMLSKTGRVRAFDTAADGFVRGEGAVMLVLKPLVRAVADGDIIRGTILGTAVGHGGRAASLTAPKPASQASVIERAMHDAGVRADDLQYIEAHGTGTPLGDVVEIAGLREALKRVPGEMAPSCAIGSVKTNIGHLEGAAGLAGVVKVLLSMDRGTLPASLGFGTANPGLGLGDGPLRVVEATSPWPRRMFADGRGAPRMAGVSSFGFGGVNAHAILAEAPLPARREPVCTAAVHHLVLSARNEAQLRGRVAALRGDLDRIDDEARLGDVAWTLQHGRDPMDKRLVVTVTSLADARQQLDAVLAADDAMAASTESTSTDALLDHWLAGGEVDWSTHPDAFPGRRIELSSYPFARTRYWIDHGAAASHPAPILTCAHWTRAQVNTRGDVGERHVLLLQGADGVTPFDQVAAAFQSRDGVICDRWVIVAHDPAESYERSGWRLLEYLKRLLATSPRGDILIQVAYVNSPGTLLRGLGGLLKTAQRENPRFGVQLIEGDANDDARAWVDAIDTSSRMAAVELRHASGVLETRRTTVLEGSVTRMPWRPDGTYLVTGGAGGLGLAFVEELFARTPAAHVFLVGRSPLRGEAASRVAAWQASGCAVDYRQVDVARRDQVIALLRDIEGARGVLHGVLHAAGVIRDSYLLRKTPEEYAQVMAPKLHGAFNLDVAIGTRPLDFFVLFSSVAGTDGNAGQGDYAAANAALDAFARQRARRVADGERHGQTLSIAWPWWSVGGMCIPDATAEELRSQGVAPLGTDDGIAAFYLALGSRAAAVAIAAPSTATVAPPAPFVAFPQPSAQTMDALALAEALAQRLKHLLAEVSGQSPERIDPMAPLERYGIDSMMVLQLNKRLGAVFERLSKTVLYEHATLRSLRDYLLSQYPEACSHWCDVEQAAPVAVPATSDNAMPTPRGAAREPIAVIGMAGRYPGARDLRTFWENLSEGRDCISEIPPERWSLEDFYDPDELQASSRGRSYGKWGGFIEGFDEFDALFFGIAPRDADMMDPQERLFLQTCWEAVEDAGYTRESLDARHDRSVGVFAGVTKTGFDLYGPALWRRGEALTLHTSFASIANRVSFVMNLQGPSMPVDTMCSASLTAIHEACEHLLRDECELALAGGVNLYLHPSSYVYMCATRMLSPSGRCRTFGAGADGMVPGEGSGVVLLKRLSRALADRDPIHGVILGTSINHGGRTHGYTVPNPLAQRDLVSAALTRAGVDASSIAYVEAHGTGTELGDPIEIAGLTQAFERSTSDRQFCAIGSVKTMIGHAESAAGIAGLTRILLQMKHGALAPSLHAEETNPHIDFTATPFFVQSRLAPWPRQRVEIDRVERERPRRAGVSSFGAGGANAHVIVEEYVAPTGEPAASSAPRPAIIVLSAKSIAARRAVAARLLHAIEADRLGDGDLHDVAHTLQVGREAMSHRLAFVVDSMDVLSQRLRAIADGESVEGVYLSDGTAVPEGLAALVDAADVTRLASAWLENGDYRKVCELWVSGLAIDWHVVPESAIARRRSLPTYPFERTRYWIAQRAMEAMPAVDKPLVSTARDAATGKPTAIALRSLAAPTAIRTERPTSPTVRSAAAESAAVASPAMAVAMAPATSLARRRDPRAVEAELGRMLGRALYMEAEDIDPRKPFAELGLDSIIGVEWLRAVNAHFHLRLPTAKIYDCPTLAQMASHVVHVLERPAETTAVEIPAPLEDEVMREDVASCVDMPTAPTRTSSLHDDAVVPKTFASEAIAIVGMSGRYPGAEDLDAFWNRLADGVDCVTEVPPDRWATDRYDVACRWLGVVDDIDAFDPLYFGISPAEAELMDPQHRLFLQEAARAFDDAGCRPADLGGARCGVYLGIMGNEYGQIILRHGVTADSTGNSGAIAAARIAYLLDLKGPAIAIDTACSSSLVATHLACQALRHGEVDMALAGGVTLYLAPELYVTMNAAGMLSSDGRCKTMDDGANGFVPGEGVGALVLKRLSDAEAAGDPIHGVILGSGINQDGKTNGITAPSAVRQAELQREVYARHGIDPATIGYVEMHGTGTKLGDPIELEALRSVYEAAGVGRQRCVLGSVKSNIGHTSAAAGVAGVHKVLLGLRHGELVPSLHFTTPNEHFDFATSPFRVGTAREAWARIDGAPRRAAVSSFGYSGTNAHLVIEEYVDTRRPAMHGQAPRGASSLFVLSARSEERLRVQAARMLDWMDAHETLDVDAFTHTLQAGREAMEHRIACAFESVSALRATLHAFVAGERHVEGLHQGEVRRHREALAAFTADDDLHGAIDAWIAKGKYDKLLDLWVKGLDVDWKTLRKGVKPRKLSLPPYPFRKQRFWVGGDASSPTTPDPPPPARRDDRTASPMTFVPRWDAVSLSSAEQVISTAARTLVFGANETDERAIRERYANARFVGTATCADVATLVETLRDESVEHVVWIARERMGDHDEYDEEAMLAAQESGLLPCFRMLRALADLGYGSRRLGLTVVTWRTQRVIVDDPIYPGHAGLHGLMGSVAKEYLLWNVRCADLDHEGDLPLAELAQLPGGADVHARRQGEWFRRRLVAFQGGEEERTAYREGGIYVIVGGAGGLGEVLSEHLIRHHHAHVVWIGRRAKDDVIASRIRRLGALGPAPLYIRADARDRDAMEAARSEILNRYGAIHGVVHSAIVLLDQGIGGMDGARFRAALSAKTDVCVRLAQVFSADSLDFVLFFSSLQSFARLPGQGNYAAGSAFEDAFADWLGHHRAQRVKVVNWGYWGTVGCVALAEYAERFARQGTVSLDPAEAMRALDGMMAGAPFQVAITGSLGLEHGQSGYIDAQDVIETAPPAGTRGAGSIDREHDASPFRDASGDLVKGLDRHLLAVLFGQLRDMGLFGAEGTTVDACRRHAGIVARHHAWFDETVALLCRHGLLAWRDGRVGAGDDAPAGDTWPAWHAHATWWRALPVLRGQVVLLETMLRALPGILRGECAATDVMFADGMDAVVETIYRDHALADHANGAMAAALDAYVERRVLEDPAARIRVLEIGAGTGGSTGAMLASLERHAANISEYAFTDLSAAFLLRARDRFADRYPFLSTKPLDIAAEPGAQGFVHGGYDVVVAANVLHATADIRRTMRHVKALLRRHGLLLIQEMSANSPTSHLTFGLLDGWWLVKDPALRLPGCPALSFDGWKRVLAEAGFDAPSLIATTGHPYAQQVIAAHGDGLVRRPRASMEQPGDLSAPALGPLADPVATTGMPSVDDPLVHVRDTVAACVCGVLRLPAADLDPDVALVHYGMDSISAGHLIQRINSALGLPLVTTDLFDHGSVDRLTDYIGQVHGDALPRTAAREQRAAPVATQSEIEGRDAIAIVGLSARFPGSPDADTLWDNLANGRELVTRVDRWPMPPADVAKGGTQPLREWRGGLLEGIDEFDPFFFNISGIEATYMDPQQRLFLEESWKALENAGYAGAAVQGSRCGVYVGCNAEDYSRLLDHVEPAQALWGQAVSLLPARISYHLDLQGPAIAVDTACSSSMVAMHLACQGLWGGEIDMALAGGVYVRCTPYFYLASARANLLSPTGRCHTFDERADGFVPSEGVAAFVLKRLADAVSAGDHIHALVVASAINQDGASNGITAPSGASQQRLLATTYKAFGIHPRQIQMVEAHGTGTKLGDPIEYQALKRTYTTAAVPRGHCALGSIKANLGHAIAAAGAAGVMRALLSLRHRRIPPAVNFGRASSHIDLSDGPFYVNTTLRDWHVADGQRRLAAVSSFGLSGTNAHMVLAEAPEPAVVEREDAPAWLVVLSAKTRAQLVEQARRLAAHLARDAVHIADVAFTLLAGRKHFEHRLACVVADTRDLVDRLERWLREMPEGDVRSAHLAGKRVRDDVLADGAAVLAHCRASAGTDAWRPGLAALAESYLRGYVPDVTALFGTGGGCRIPLPTYPFAREHYWVGHADPTVPRATVTPEAPVHRSMLSISMPGADESAFGGRMDGNEVFLRDHVVNGARVMPAVGYVELMREGLSRAHALADQTARVLRLSHMGWSQPLVVGETPVDVRISLDPHDTGGFSYEVRSQSGGQVDESRLHARGTAEWVVGEPATCVDPAELDRRCERSLDTTACYQAFAARGIDYGPTHRTLRRVAMGCDAAGHPYVMATLEAPDAPRGGDATFFLDPGLMDGALQAIIGWSLDDDATDALLDAGGAWVPYALDRVEVLGPLNGRAYAVLTRSASTQAHLPKFDIRLHDADGLERVRIDGCTMRRIGERTVLLARDWRSDASPIAAAGEGLRHAVLCTGIEDDGGTHSRVAASLDALDGWRAEHWDLPYAGTAERCERYGWRLLEAVRALSAESSRQDVLIQVVGGDEVLLRGLSGLLKTARIEHPGLRWQTIEADLADASDAWVKHLRADAGRGVGEIRYRAGIREVATWTETAPASTGSLPWREGGVYVITGGMGGLGMSFAEYLGRNVKNAHVVLVGRSELDNERRRRLQAWLALGYAIEYRQADLAGEDAARDLVDYVLRRYGALHGVLHAAAVVRDSLLARKTAEEFAAVWRSKVHVATRLDDAIGERALDFFIVFSAAAGAWGNLGQADYAAANAYMDGFAQGRQARVVRGERQGRSLAIAWPLWEEGGLRMSAPARERMERQGFRALATAEGIAALERAWATPHAGVAVVRAGADWRLADPAPAPTPVAPVTDAPAPASDALAISLGDAPDVSAKTLDFLARMLSEEVRFPRDRIDATEPFESYGIDSTLVMQMTARLEESFGPLSKTLFFEHQNLGELCDYFLQSHLARLRTLLGVAETKASVAPTAPPPVPELAVAARATVPMRATQPRQAPPPSDGPLDIAIVGLGGRYPQADTLEEFWNNLRDGRDAVTEIPATRWDHHRYFDAEVGKPGKSYSKWGGFISGVDEFDPLFFNMSPLEARQTDPQERLFLQCVYQTLEDAGQTRESLRRAGRVGVFVGAMYQEYQLYAAQAQARGEALVVGASLGSIANRISYFCDFHGPSLSVDTMCSSSLTALHLACQSLRTGDCEVAIAGGVNVSVHPNKYLMLSHAQFASSTGRCTAFAAGGDGYVPAEAVGAVLLRPLAAALADRDQIYGVIKAIEVNHGGRTNAYTVPSPKAQAELIGRVIERSGVPPRAISYLEAHGTGTALGDPIEVAGLQQAFSRDIDARGLCAIGSVKSNIGHAESAAGIAGLTKVLLQLRHGELAPSLHARTLNPHIDFDDSPFTVQRERAPWPRPMVVEAGGIREYPRVAGISSFGAGGSNAHMIVQEHRADDVARVDPSSWPTPVVLLSARNEERLRVRVQQLLAMLERTPDEAIDLHDVAYTLQVGRESMDHRFAVVADSHGRLKEALRRYLDGDREADGMHVGAVRHDRFAQSLLSPDEDMQRATEAWLAKGRYAKLLDLWVVGLAVDWTRLYGASKPRRISLPTYPFARQRYWPDEPVVSAPAAVATPVTAAVPSSVDDDGALMLVPAWEPLPRSARATSAAPSGRTIVIGASAEHAAALEGAQGGAAERLSLPPTASVEDIAIVLRGASRVARVVWFAPARDDAGIDDADGLVDAQETGVIACFRLAKALLAEGYGDTDLHWTVVTWRTQAVSAAADVDPAHAGVQGLVGSFAREYPRWHVRGVDLPHGGNDALRALAAMPDEARGATLAWRHGVWHRQRLLPYVARREAPAFRQGGVYVVVGGAGGIGTVLTEHLVRHYKARVWWIGRRAEDDDAIRSKLDALSRLGPAPIYCRADAADRSALEEVCRRIEALHPTIHGVVHSAIVLDDASVERMTESSLRAALRAKVDASVRTAEVFLPRCQDFMLFFSSMQSHSRSAGQGNYAAGCAFKDAFAQRLAMRGAAVKLINWGYWGSVGVVAEPAYRDAMAALGIGSIEPIEGMAALEAAMADDARQLAFVRTTRPGALGDLVGDDRIERLPPGLPSLPPTTARAEAATPPPADPVGLERSQAVLLGVQLREAGLWKMEDERLESAAIHRWQAEHVWAPHHARWLARSLDLLARHEVLRAEADGYALSETAREDAAVVWARWHAERQAWRELPSASVQAELAEYTLRGLPDVLLGRRAATDLLFPNGSMSRVAPVYARNAVADHFNALLVARLADWIEARREADPDARLRLLEIGAGTGGTSGAVLELIDRHAPAVETYDYTDLSGAFLQHGRDHHGSDRSYMRFLRFDVERPPVIQGVALGAYDVVIAANVMHATSDVRRAVRHAKALLGRHGLLLLNEIGDAGLFEQLTFGLLEGWWRHADDGVRPSGTPALSADRWAGVLQAEGFTDVHVDASPGHRQQVISALSDGWLRHSPEGGQASPATDIPPAPLPASADAFEEAALAVLSRLTGVAAGDIDPDAPLGEYGVDSIVSRRLVQEMERAFPVSLAAGVLLEHNSVRALAAHVSHLVATRNDLAAVPIEEALEHFRGGQLDMDAIEALLDEGMPR